GVGPGGGVECSIGHGSLLRLGFQREEILALHLVRCNIVLNDPIQPRFPMLKRLCTCRAAA
ncbi:MAG TPA: hypothetical protein VNE18_03635, partial [Rhodanobacter sp.]|nr:hypothetical protein [Rhodanobacter sp.]